MNPTVQWIFLWIELWVGAFGVTTQDSVFYIRHLLSLDVAFSEIQVMETSPNLNWIMTFCITAIARFFRGVAIRASGLFWSIRQIGATGLSTNDERTAYALEDFVIAVFVTSTLWYSPATRARRIRLSGA
jgi:hypothetical protein